MPNKSKPQTFVLIPRIDPASRLERHLEEYYGHSKFTTMVDDWVLFYRIECTSFTQAIKIENHLKKMKSKTFIQNLAIYQEITERLLERYSH